MAQIKILRDVLDEIGWPEICACCTETATEMYPIPEHYSRNEELSIPLCNQHANHWQRFAQARQKALLLFFVITSIVFALLWVAMDPLSPGNHARLSALIALTVVFAALLGFVLIRWVGVVVKVSDATLSRITLTGVSKPFARLGMKRVSSERALPQLDPERTFEVRAFKPDFSVSLGGGLKLILLPLILCGCFGVLLSIAALELDKLTLGWKENDLRYLALIAGLLSTYGAVGFWLTTKNGIFPGIIGAMLFALVLALLAGLCALIRIFPLSFGLALALNVPMLLMVTAVVDDLIRKNHIRHPWLAQLVGFVMPLSLAATAYFLSGEWDGPQGRLAVLGPIIALTGASIAGETARRPYCRDCGCWMNEHLLTVLRRRPDEMKSLIEGGELLRLVGEEFDPLLTPEDGDSNLKLFFCPEGLEQCDVVLEVGEYKMDGHSSIELKELGRWVYPVETWLVIQEVAPFDPTAVEEMKVSDFDD